MNYFNATLVLFTLKFIFNGYKFNEFRQNPLPQRSIRLSLNGYVKLDSLALANAQQDLQTAYRNFLESHLLGSRNSKANIQIVTAIKRTIKKERLQLRILQTI